MGQVLSGICSPSHCLVLVLEHSRYSKHTLRINLENWGVEEFNFTFLLDFKENFWGDHVTIRRINLSNKFIFIFI